MSDPVYSLLRQTDKGLYCEAGGFYVDPSRAVDTAIVTHAHSDHARRGSREYICEASGVGVLKSRLGAKISARGIPYGKPIQLGRAWVSLHPAGHILGSAQVRIEADGEVWVVSGDYKREPDPTCEPYEVVECDVFVTEATFGTPAYQWEKGRALGQEIYDWWTKNSKEGVNSVLFAYSLGKAQRVLGELHPFASRDERTVLTHESVSELTECYRREGVVLAQTVCLSTLSDDRKLGGELILAPPSILKGDFERRLGRYATAFASGWMQSSSGYFRGGYDKGFVMSDHADWNDLVRSCLESKARKIYVVHRGNGALVRHLRGLGIDANPVSELEKPLPRQELQLRMF